MAKGGYAVPQSHRAVMSIARRLVVPVVIPTVVLAGSAAHLDAQTTRAASSAYASDSFGRSVTNGWGNADTGGAYTIGGKVGDFSVSSNAGRIALPGGVSRFAMLMGVWQRDVDISFHFRLDKRPVGGSIWIYAVARQVSSGNEYLAKVRLNPDGSVAVSASKVVNDAETPIGGQVTLTALYNAGATWNLHAAISQASPTTIGVSAWPSSSSAPASWQYSGQDSTSSLQSAGATGVLAYSAPSLTNGPIALAFETYSVVAPASSVAPPPTSGYYVSTSGSDGNAGTIGAPFRTLQKAADTVPAGATVYLRGGTYGPFVMRRSGTASAPITFTAYPGESAVVDGNNAVAYTIKVVGAHDLRFTNLSIRGGYADGYAGAGITTENSANIEIRNNLISDNKAWGVRLYNSTYVTVDNNEVTRNAVGIHVNLAGEGVTITNNRVHDDNKLIIGTPCSVNCDDDVGGEGIALVKSTGHVTVSGNSIWANRAVSSDWGYDGAAFSIYAASNWTIRDNVTWNNRNVMETGTDTAKTPCNNNTFVRNLNYAATTVDRTVGMVLRCGSNMLVANNTFDGIQYFVFDISHNYGGWGGSVDGLRILNNIISSSGRGVRDRHLAASHVGRHRLQPHQPHRHQSDRHRCR